MNSIPPLYKATAAAAPAKAAAPAAKASAIPPHVSTLQNSSTASTQSVAAAPANKPVVTAEGVMQRLKYFETLAGQYEHYILTLQASLHRTGTAVPAAYFAALTGEGGSYMPKVSS